MAPPNLDWDNIAASADGQRIIACAGGEPGWVYSSPDAGVTWFTNNLPDLGWTAVASSADGSKLFAVAVFGGIYTSTDFGVSWLPTQAPVNDWWAVSSSADGSKLAAAVGGQSGFLRVRSSFPRIRGRIGRSLKRLRQIGRPSPPQPTEQNWPPPSGSRNRANL